MTYEVVYTDNFEREAKRLAKKYPSIEKDLEGLINLLEVNPIQGTPIGKHCYKIRLAIKSKGKGRSGGARVITHIYAAKKFVYLLSIYDKSTRESISDKELNALLDLLK